MSLDARRTCEPLGLYLVEILVVGSSDEQASVSSEGGDKGARAEPLTDWIGWRFLSETMPHSGISQMVENAL